MENPTHTYTSVGVYTVTLTVEGSISHCTDVDTTTVTVTSTVVSDADGPYEGVVGIPIDFTGSASDGVPPYQYYWSFGDNTYSYDQNPSYKYKQPGNYTVSLKVTDDTDGQATDSTYAIIHPPGTLVADARGPYSGDIDQVIAFTGNAIGGVLPYTFEWDLDNDGDYDDATGQTASKSWSTVGTYTIGLKVTDNIGTTDTDTAQVSITSQAPNKPSKPSGPTSGEADTEYTYTSSTTDPDGDQVYYWFDWDDGTNSGWIGPLASGATGSAKHTWTSQGSYQIKVKAKDTNGVESPWSDPLSVSMPKNKPYTNRPVLQLLQNLMQRFPLLARLLQLPVFEKLMNP
jgi:PKD repeat protein